MIARKFSELIRKSSAWSFHQVGRSTKVSWMFNGHGPLILNVVAFPSNLDNGGYYFWHIKSGTIQREMPLWPKELKTPVIPPTRWGKNSFIPLNGSLTFTQPISWLTVQFPVAMEPTVCSQLLSTPSTTITPSQTATSRMAAVTQYILTQLLVAARPVIH